METTFKRLLEGDDFVFLDGAMGTMIQKSGAKYNHVPEELNISNPELLTSIAKVYSDAGAQIVYANTFGANAYKLEDTGLDVRTVVTAAVANARKGVAGTDTLVALDIGPIGQLLEPAGALAFEDAYNYFKEMVLAGKDADVAVIETMTDLYEAKAALLAVKENSDLPVLVTLTYEESGRTFAGVSAEAAALTLSGLGATPSASTVPWDRISWAGSSPSSPPPQTNRWSSNPMPVCRTRTPATTPSARRPLRKIWKS